MRTVGQCDVGITRHAKHEKEALKLLEWLSSEKAQNLFADVNLECPVNPAVKPDAVVAAWGAFKQNVVNVAKAGELQATCQCCAAACSLLSPWYSWMS